MLVAVVFLTAIVGWFTFRVRNSITVVHGTSSMLPTIKPGEQVIIDKGAYLVSKPKRLDIIAFNPPINTNWLFIMRIVGLPGESCSIASNRFTANGVMFLLPVAPTVVTNGFGITNVYVVPPDGYFVIGDNMSIANDSRYWGAVSERSIVGKVLRK